MNVVLKGGLSREEREQSSRDRARQGYILLSAPIPKPGVEQGEERHNNMTMTMTMTSMEEVTCTLVSA